jgi:hypothetical protein
LWLEYFVGDNKQKRYYNTMLFRVESEIVPVVQIRLKVEINCFEHFSVLGLIKIPFGMENSWFTGSTAIENVIRIHETTIMWYEKVYEKVMKSGKNPNQMFGVSGKMLIFAALFV